QSRAAAGPGKDLFKTEGHALSELQRKLQPTQFLGYSEVAGDAVVLGIILDGRAVDAAQAGDRVEIILDRTPFYAESGGQVGDTGMILRWDGPVTCGLRASVKETTKSGG